MPVALIDLNRLPVGYTMFRNGEEMAIIQIISNLGAVGREIYFYKLNANAVPERLLPMLKAEDRFAISFERFLINKMQSAEDRKAVLEYTNLHDVVTAREIMARYDWNIEAVDALEFGLVFNWMYHLYHENGYDEKLLEQMKETSCFELFFEEFNNDESLFKYLIFYELFEYWDNFEQEDIFNGYELGFYFSFFTISNRDYRYYLDVMMLVYAKLVKDIEQYDLEKNPFNPKAIAHLKVLQQDPALMKISHEIASEFTKYDDEPVYPFSLKFLGHLQGDFYEQYRIIEALGNYQGKIFVNFSN